MVNYFENNLKLNIRMKKTNKFLLTSIFLRHHYTILCVFETWYTVIDTKISRFLLVSTQDCKDIYQILITSFENYSNVYKRVRKLENKVQLTAILWNGLEAGERFVPDMIESLLDIQWYQLQSWIMCVHKSPS